MTPLAALLLLLLAACRSAPSQADIDSYAATQAPAVRVVTLCDLRECPRDVLCDETKLRAWVAARPGVYWITYGSSTALDPSSP